MTPDTLPLRDIHLPDPVSWWPPAPGWWALLCLVIVLAVCSWLLLRWQQRTAIRRHSKAAFDAIELSYNNSHDDQALARSLSVLMRRLCLSHFPHEQVAGLTGEAWLAWLDNAIGGDDFRHGAGQVLITAPYRPQQDIDGPALLALCRRWADSLPARRVAS